MRGIVSDNAWRLEPGPRLLFAPTTEPDHMSSIFISYRREDSAGYAGRLHEELEGRLGAGEVFRDVDTLQAGQDFDAAIRQRLQQCRACVVMIGPGWLQSRTASGQRRLDQPNDYVALEIAAALTRPDVVVIPVLVGGASMPGADDLPEPLRPLSRRHALTVRDETWEADMDRLAAIVQAAVGSRARPRGSAAAAAAAADASGSPVAALQTVRRFALPGLIAVAVAIAALLFFTRGEGDNDTPAQSLSEGPAVAIDVPGAGSEISHGDLIYTVLAGSVQRRGSSMRVWLRVRASNEGFGDANLWDDSFRLLVDGQTVRASGGLNEILERRSIRQVVVRFDVPVVSSAGRLQVSHQEQSAELPLDLSGNGGAPKHDDADPRDASSHAVFTPVLRTEIPLLSSGETTTTVMRATRRAFVNKQRITVVVKWTNDGRYDIATGDLTLRLAVGGEVRPPVKMPSEVVAGNATWIGDVVFDVPPDLRSATLRAALGQARVDKDLTLR